MPLTIVCNDITRMNVDAIVNAANPGLRPGGGVCGAIFNAAGYAELNLACRYTAPVATGSAAITGGFRLPVRAIIHAVGPVYFQHSPAESRRLLASAYTSALTLAAEYGFTSIAFPLISSGIYGYPKEEALQVARQAILAFLNTHEDMDVYLVIYDRDSFAISRGLIREVDRYLSEHKLPAPEAPGRLGEESSFAFHEAPHFQPSAAPEPQAAYPKSGFGYGSSQNPDYADEATWVEDSDDAFEGSSYGLEEAPTVSVWKTGASLSEKLSHLDKPFSQALLELIDQKGKSDAEVYRKANIDRRLFSKIRSGKNGYTPKKTTILALAISLELTKQETQDLLSKAGYALSPSSTFDVIVEFFLESRRYNIFEINETLFAYNQPTLGC